MSIDKEMNKKFLNKKEKIFPSLFINKNNGVVCCVKQTIHKWMGNF